MCIEGVGDRLTVSPKQVMTIRPLSLELIVFPDLKCVGINLGENSGDCATRV